MYNLGGCTDKFACDGNVSRTCTDNADICLNGVPWFKLFGIEKHGEHSYSVNDSDPEIKPGFFSDLVALAGIFFERLLYFNF